MAIQKVAILPSSVSLVASTSNLPPRFLRLPHPRTHQPTLFLPYTPTPPSSSTSDLSSPAQDGLLEVQQIKPPADTERSWFVDQAVVSDGALTLLTPFDPLFLLVSLLTAPSLRGTDAYLPASDLWDKVSEVEWLDLARAKDAKVEGVEMREDVLRFAEMECVQRRMAQCCETKEHDNALLYRFSLPRALAVLQSKVDTLSESLFGAYERTTLGELKTEEGAPVVVEGSARPHATVSRGLAREGLGDGVGLSEAIQRETRQKSAIGILSNYLPPALSTALLAAYSFPLLTAHLAISSSTTSSVLGTTYLPGRNGSTSSSGTTSNGFGAAAAERDKKRKLESARTSRGVKELANVSKKGMMKLEDMFKKKPAAVVVKKGEEKKDGGAPAKAGDKRKADDEGAAGASGSRKSPRKSKG